MTHLWVQGCVFRAEWETGSAASASQHPYSIWSTCHRIPGSHRSRSPCGRVGWRACLSHYLHYAPWWWLGQDQMSRVSEQSPGTEKTERWTITFKYVNRLNWVMRMSNPWCPNDRRLLYGLRHRSKWCSIPFFRDKRRETLARELSFISEKTEEKRSRLHIGVSQQVGGTEEKNPDHHMNREGCNPLSITSCQITPNAKSYKNLGDYLDFPRTKSHMNYMDFI